MRKTFKKALSVVLSTAMVFTMGSIGTLANDTSAKAAEKPDFNATIRCYGNFYGWESDTPQDTTATTHVTDYGEYSVSFAAPDAFTDLNEMSGAFVVQTDLTAEPSGYTIAGKTFKVGETSYDWSKAVAYLDGGNIRLSARNEWGDEKANPLTGQTIAINKGDIVTFTFEVKGGADAPAPEQTPAPADPTTAPSTPSGGDADFNATIRCYGNFYGWESDTPQDTTATTHVTGFGEYSVSFAAPDAFTDLNEMSGAFVVQTDLTAEPAGYTIAGKTLKIGETSYDWSKAISYLDGENVRISARNEWGDEKANPLAGQVIPINKGDIITFTFEVKAGTAAPADPTTAPSTPSDGNADFNATIRCYGNFYGWESDTPQDTTATTHVTGFGEYSVSFAAPDAFTDLNEMSGAFVVQTDLTAEPAGYTITGKTIKVGETSYDWSKAISYLDGENVRLSARNEWGKEDYANPLVGQIIPINKGDIITFTFEVKAGTSTPASEPTTAPAEPTAAPAQSYNAYLGFQTDVWDYRDDYEKDSSSKDYNFFNQVVIGGQATDVEIKNAEITSNGTYSVKISGTDLTNATVFNMLYISTDIPAAMKDVKFSDIKVIIDDAEVATLSDGVIKKEVQQGSKKYYMVMVVNTYGTAGTDLPESFTYTMPSKSMELQFTVSGLDLDNDYSTQTAGPAKGTTFTSGNFKYKVTTAAKVTAGKATNGKVEVTGLSNAGKKKSSVSVGASVKYTSDGQDLTYTISSVAAGAFKGASKLKKVTLGKNIKSINKNTFQNCSKLTGLKLNAKLSSVAKNSFKGCKKTIKVTGTSKSANIKILKKQNSSVKFK